MRGGESNLTIAATTRWGRRGSVRMLRRWEASASLLLRLVEHAPTDARVPRWLNRALALATAAEAADQVEATRAEQRGRLGAGRAWEEAQGPGGAEARHDLAWALYLHVIDRLRHREQLTVADWTELQAVLRRMEATGARPLAAAGLSAFADSCVAGSTRCCRWLPEEAGRRPAPEDHTMSLPSTDAPRASGVPNCPEELEAVSIGLHGSRLQRFRYALRRILGLLVADDRPQQAVLLSLVTEVRLLEGRVAALREHPEGAALLADQPQINMDVVDSLGHLPADTLGGAFHRFTKRNGVDPAYFNPLPLLSGDCAYIHNRMNQTHDLWHVVTGYETRLIDEVMISGFYFGQLGTVLPFFSATMGFLSMALKFPWAGPEILRSWRRGRRARQLMPVYWERRWHLPLHDVRRELGVEPTALSGRRTGREGLAQPTVSALQP